MLCQHCQKRPATTHIKRTVNGKSAELHLCAQCAKEQGISPLGGLTMDFGNFWGNLFGEPTALTGGTATVCEGCGSTFEQIARSGRVGCPTCYATFFERLLPSIERVHGKTRHMGKQPSAAGEQAQKQQQIADLKKQLQASVESQQYEECARLRDQIKALEDENGQEGEA